MSTFFCSRCGRELREGSLKYVVDISIFADFDGVLDESEEDIEKEVKRLLSNMEGMDTAALEEDVFQEINFILCKDCKERFKKILFNPTIIPMEDENETKGTLH